MPKRTEKSKPKRYAKTIDELAAELERTPAELYRYWSRDAPKRKTRYGYSIGPLRRWIEQNVKTRDRSTPTNGHASDKTKLEKLEFSIKFWERACKRERAKNAALERERAEGRLVPLEDYEELGLTLIQLFNRGMDDLVRSIPGLPKKHRDKLTEVLHDVRNRIADELEQKGKP